MTIGLLGDIIGLIGSSVMVGAYAYSNAARTIDFRLFNLLNLIGALLLIASLSIHFNLASMALEIVWAIIAFVSLVQAVRKRA